VALSGVGSPQVRLRARGQRGLPTGSVPYHGLQFDRSGIGSQSPTAPYPRAFGLDNTGPVERHTSFGCGGANRSADESLIPDFSCRQRALSTSPDGS